MSKIIGHRGVAGLAPENTLAAIKKAVALNFSWIELDVRLVKDGEPVMFHDAELMRTTNGHGYLNGVTIDEALRLDVGSWFGDDSYISEKIPTLLEALEYTKKLGLGLNLELKPDSSDHELLVEKVHEVLQQTEFPASKLIVSSFEMNTLALFRGLSDHRLACIFERLPHNWQQKAEEVNAVNIHLEGAKLSQKELLMVKKAGYGSYCYTVNDVKLAGEIFSWGVDGVFSDYPQSHWKCG